jgi:hypothetical protein
LEFLPLRTPRMHKGHKDFLCAFCDFTQCEASSNTGFNCFAKEDYVYSFGFEKLKHYLEFLPLRTPRMHKGHKDFLCALCDFTQ